MERSPLQPAYLLVARSIRRAIGNGVHPVGSALPSAAALGGTYEVSPTVVAAALRELRSEGLIAGRTGDGSIVRDVPGRGSSSCLDG